MIKRFLLFLVFPLVLSGCIGSFLQGSGGAEAKGFEFVKGQAVKGFPPVPQYSKSQLIESFGYNNKFGVSYVTGDSVSEVLKFYAGGLPQLGWDIVLKKRSETNYVYEIKNAKYGGTIIINTADDGKKTAITIALSPR